MPVSAGSGPHCSCRMPINGQMRETCRGGLPAATLVASLFVAYLGLASNYASAAEPLRRPHALEPIVLLRDGNLEGCGVKVVYFTPKAKIDLDVVALRQGDGTTFDLSVFWRDRYDRPQSISGFHLETPTLKSIERFPSVSATGPGRLSTRKDLDQLSGAQFIQGLMVSGGSLSVTDGGGVRHDFAIPGPMQNLIRASYLNCSGDLFRPSPGNR